MVEQPCTGSVGARCDLVCDPRYVVSAISAEVRCVCTRFDGSDDDDGGSCIQAAWMDATCVLDPEAGTTTNRDGTTNSDFTTTFMDPTTSDDRPFDPTGTSETIFGTTEIPMETPENPNGNDDGGGNNGTVIILAIIFGIIALLLCLCVCRRQRKKSSEEERRAEDDFLRIESQSGSKEMVGTDDIVDRFSGEQRISTSPDPLFTNESV